MHIIIIILIIIGYFCIEYNLKVINNNIKQIMEEIDKIKFDKK